MNFNGIRIELRQGVGAWFRTIVSALRLHQERGVGIASFARFRSMVL
jgi:hypothetical protein